MKSLKAISIVLASVMAYSAPASAYWTQILVCPKKKVTTTKVKYHCTHSGTLYSTGNNVDYLNTSYQEIVEDTTCRQQRPINHHYENGKVYAGYLYLSKIVDLSYPEVIWVDDPAGCYLKDVWVDDMDKECIRNNNCPGD
ncbi:MULTISPECIES: hypothetical protein [unclassified Pseudoalteromonas]|uniref:hypothetical protein n=1 Tax=unclassified Pseudoalteromonas TaxID=194690 RepID=UPI0018915420|nr:MULTISPECIES: hypothetical protein [unclassified Pseudoalteromonas]MCG7563159.1 hypothetical protein [Pseudoalteromonas sp. McH1-42]